MFPSRRRLPPSCGRRDRTCPFRTPRGRPRQPLRSARPHEPKFARRGAHADAWAMAAACCSSARARSMMVGASPPADEARALCFRGRQDSARFHLLSHPHAVESHSRKAAKKNSQEEAQPPRKSSLTARDPDLTLSGTRRQRGTSGLPARLLPCRSWLASAGKNLPAR